MLQEGTYYKWFFGKEVFSGGPVKVTHFKKESDGLFSLIMEWVSKDGDQLALLQYDTLENFSNKKKYTFIKV